MKNRTGSRPASATLPTGEGAPASVLNHLRELTARVDVLEGLSGRLDAAELKFADILTIVDAAYSLGRRSGVAELAGEKFQALAGMPDALAAALEHPAVNALVRVPLCGRRVAVVLTGARTDDKAARAAVLERIEAIVEEVADRPVASVGMVRTELPEAVAALAWQSGGHPVVVVSFGTRRAALRRALHAAGHDLVGGAA